MSENKTLVEWLNKKTGVKLDVLKAVANAEVGVGLYDPDTNEIYLVGIVEEEKKDSSI